MYPINSERIVNRIEQLVSEIQHASGLDYHDRLREFKNFCETTPILFQHLSHLPNVPYDFSVDWRELAEQWPGGLGSYAMRWDAIKQIAEGGSDKLDEAWGQLGGQRKSEALEKIIRMLILPVAHYLLDQLSQGSTMAYLLLRYKRWAEWFETENLREIYARGGEELLDQNLRRFLFENGIDYPFSQPVSPGGKVDIVANLETDDPLVLEVKIWDSAKRYRENRVRDGLRQAMNYAARYGKNTGYVVVFNLDQEPLHFVDETTGVS